jgi:argininosuccinate lyase
MKLWDKNGLSLDKEIEEFEVGDDNILDLNLAPFDIYGNAAHVRMLHKIGIISKEEMDKILVELKKILESIDKNEFTISVQDEDVHTKVENIITSKLKDIGKKVHTARSRNDQILVDTRLFAKHQLFNIGEAVLSVCEILNKFAKDYEFIPMPGYTHMQIAMPSSVGMWASSFVENLLDEFILLQAVADLNDMNPLGSGAAYGVSLDIDREYTTKLLGFKKVQKNSLYCGNSRGKIESHIINVLCGFSLVLNRIASDLLLFTTKEFGFFTYTDNISTGSSIMPQKKNLDVMELIRGKTHVLIANDSQMKHLIANLPSGYNRDYQESKRLLIQSFKTLHQMLSVTKVVFQNLTPNQKNLEDKMIPEIYSADVAYQMVKNDGMPFREAYKKVGENLDLVKNQDPVENIKSKTHIGSTGNLKLQDYDERIKTLDQAWTTQQDNFQKTLEKLL